MQLPVIRLPRAHPSRPEFKIRAISKQKVMNTIDHETDPSASFRLKLFARLHYIQNRHNRYMGRQLKKVKVNLVDELMQLESTPPVNFTSLSRHKSMRDQLLTLDLPTSLGNNGDDLFSSR